MDAQTKMEFAVNMTCQSCENAVRDSLSDVKGITSIEIDINKQSVVLTTTQPSSVIQEAIETTGMLAIIRGQGSGKQQLGAGISILKDHGKTLGLVRFVQVDEATCVIDASFNGLSPGKYGLHIHELGDLSQGCKSTGDDYNPHNSCHGDRTHKNRHVGDLGNILINENGSCTLKYKDNLIKVHDIIGRSVVIHEREDDLSSENHGNAGKGMACGIIARSAGLFQNVKKVCACSGKTLWQEREDVKNLIGIQTTT